MTDEIHKIFLIDDNEVDNFINREIIKKTKLPAEIYEFTSAVKALDFFENPNGDKLPDIIFLDINMPVMDGFEFLQRFYGLRNEKLSMIKIIILTSSDNPEDIRRIESFSGDIDYIVKPLRPEKIRTLGLDDDIQQG